MKIICTANKGSDIPKQAVRSGNTLETDFGLVVGEEYIVYGIGVYKGILHYLTMGKGLYDNYPDWFPADLFDVSVNLLPLEWYFKYFGDSEEHVFSAIWGYRELVLDETHQPDLVERKPDAVKIFLKRKVEIEEFM